MVSLVQRRKAFAEELRVAAPVKHNSRILRAFATVPREKFLPPGPWIVHGNVSYRTPDSDPAWLSHNVLVSIDLKKNLNNGSPSFWAYLFDHIDIAPGQRVFQIGAGTGYYTAILAHLVGPSGRVRAVEVEPRLAAMARRNLRKHANVEVIHGDGSIVDPGECDLIVAFTGGTHPPPVWLDRLSVGGRLLMPIVGDSGGGFMLRATKRRAGFDAKALGQVYVFLAKGFRDKTEARGLERLIRGLKGKLPRLRSLHRGKAPGKRGVVFAGRSYWLSGK